MQQASQQPSPSALRSGRRSRWAAASAFLSTVSFAAVAKAALIASFSFNQLTSSGGQSPPIYADSTTTAGGNSAAYVTNGTFNAADFASGSGSTSNADPANPNSAVAGQALALQTSGVSNDGGQITVRFSTRGYTNIAFSFATQKSDKGFTTESLEYTTNKNGLSYAAWGSVQPTSDFAVSTFSGIAAMNNVTDVLVRMTFNGIAGKANTPGTNLIDNVQITGTSSAPEPNAAILISIVLTALSMARRRMA